MRRFVILLSALLALHVPSTSRAQSAPTVAQIGWMAGCWEQSAGARVIEEQWMRPRAGLMLGVSRTVVGDSLREYEQVALFERGGRLVYAATPARQAPAEFKSIAVSDSAVTFENPDARLPATRHLPPQGRRLAPRPRRRDARRPAPWLGLSLPPGALLLMRAPCAATSGGPPALPTACAMMEIVPVES